jgi:hypothetical protein
MTMVSEARPAEKKLLSIIKRIGGMAYSVPQTLVFGSTTEARRW